MKKIKSMLFLALVLAITATSVFATDGQIPIMGRAASEANKTTASIITTTIEPENEISSEISDYLLTLASIVSQFKF